MSSAVPSTPQNFELDEFEALECDHLYVVVSDAIGNFAESHLWQEITYMECSVCGATRDLTDADEERLRDDAAAERWEAREWDRNAL